jgi:hypothetical protein
MLVLKGKGVPAIFLIHLDAMDLAVSPALWSGGEAG